MEPVDATTITHLLEPAAVDFEALRQRHGLHLELGRKLLGVIPNCYRFLEIWPTGFRTYNLLVPNFLNVPFSLFGLSTSLDVIGLAMYASSRAAQCMYCSAHACSFALRRGASEDAVAGAVATADRQHESPAERAVIRLADRLSRVPCALTADDVDALRQHMSETDIEWIAHVVIMMGFLNKAMDALGVDLEAALVSDVERVLSPSGWSPNHHGVAVQNGAAMPFRRDTLRDKLSLLPYMPRALMQDMQWKRDVPSSWPRVGAFLEERVGYEFPVLARVRSKRIVQTTATMLRDNLDEGVSELGIRNKHLAGLVYGTTADNDELARASLAMANTLAHPIRESTSRAIVAFARQSTDFDDDDSLATAERGLLEIDGLDDRTTAILMLAKAASPSPARLTPEVLNRWGARLSAPALIELVVWLSMTQLLHRLMSFHDHAAGNHSNRSADPTR